MARAARLLWKNNDGSVAPTVALSLFALVAVGGIAFDYAHMAALDTELQDAADQAALAAVTQLDGNSGAITRATAAAQYLVANKTFFANDSNTSGTAVTVPTVTFYASAADAEANTNAITSDTTAKYVRVAVESRKAYFALTPIVAAYHSPDIGAEAVAGLKSSICKVPPLLLCNPAETSTNLSFDPAAYIGKGVKLVAQGGSGAWMPGDFGYLNNNATGNGAPGLRQLLGWNVIPGDCVDVTQGDTKPGLNTTVVNAFNTRFDIFDNGPGDSCPIGGTCSPASNTVKDVVRPANSNGCSFSNNGPQWQLPTDSKNNPTYYGSGTFPTANKWPYTRFYPPQNANSGPVMGFPRDECHAVSSGNSYCAALGGGSATSDGRIGNGAWDMNAYFAVNYGWVDGSGVHSWRKNTGLNANAHRYDVYKWEVNHAGQVIDGVTVLGPRSTVTSPAASALTSYGLPQCRAVAPANIPDRRRISIAVANCTADNVRGSTPDVPIIAWVDVFLVEPSLDRARTSKGDIYVEVIGRTTGSTTTTTGGGQVTRRDVPYLIQ
jgi:Flp pilus assembly protein TadG